MFFKNLMVILLLSSAIFLGWSPAWCGEREITNGGFEGEVDENGAPVDWTKYGGVFTRAGTPDPVNSGTYSGALNGNSGSLTTKYFYQTITGIIPGNGYTFSGYAAENSDYISGVQLKIYWYASADGSGSYIGTPGETALTNIDSDTFQSLTTGEQTAPSGDDNAHSAKVRCSVTFTEAPVDATAYFDDMTLTCSADTTDPTMDSARASDPVPTANGINDGDRVVIRFSEPTNGPTIDAANGTIGGVDIDTVLSLDNSHTWKDGSGAIGSDSAWSTIYGSNDTLTIVLSTSGGAPDVAKDDIITPDGSTIKDLAGNNLTGTATIVGSFDRSDYEGKVLINEVCVDPQTDWSTDGFVGTDGGGTVSQGVDEFIELYINEAGITDLSSWTLELLDGSDVTGDLTTSGAFAVRNYFRDGSVISWPASTVAGDYAVFGNVAGSGAMNNDIWVILKDADGVYVDSVTLGSYDDGNTADNAPSGDADDTTDEVVARDASSTDTDVDSADFSQKNASIGEANYFTGVVDITSGVLCGTADMANVKVTDSDLNTDTGSQETTTVVITSSVPGSSSITLTLEETGNDTGIFDARTKGTLLGVTTGGSTDNLIQVTDGCTITATYTDDNPFGYRTDTATYRSYVIRINEVSFKETNEFDWIELYCVNDGNSGNGVDINNLGLYLEDDDTGDTRLHKTFRPGIRMKTGDYLVVYSALDSSMAVTFLNVEEGDSCVIQGRYDGSTRGPSILIDGGRIDYGATVLDYLQREGIGTSTSPLELMIATHPDVDHIGSLAYILGQRYVKEVWNSGYPGATQTYTDFVTAIGDETYEEDDVTYSSTHTIPPTAGATYNITRASNDYGINVKVLNNRNTMPYSDTNASSIVTQVSYGNVSFMLTGDAESSVASEDEAKGVEEKLINAYGIGLTSDILKVGHHGTDSATSDNFLTYVDPDIATISVGSGQGVGWYHPRVATLNRLTSHSVPYYCTGTGETVGGAPTAMGDIPIYTNGLTWYWDEASSGSDGVINTYYTKISLTSTDEQVVLKDGDGNIIDAVCWADDADLTSTEQEDVTNIYNANEWNNNTGASCIDSDTVSTNYSIGRDHLSTDSNSKGDWTVYSTPTPGTNNGDKTPPTNISGLGINNDPFLSDGSDLSRRDTSISFHLDRKSEVTIRMYDGRGRTVKTLGDKIVLVRGNHTAKWDGKNNSGDSVPIGIYTVQVSAVASDESGTDTEEITVTVAKSLSGGGSGGCFIATAAYSGYESRVAGYPEKSLCSYGAGEKNPLPVTHYPLPDNPVTILRSFRDQYLLTNPLGRAFVSTYYRISPPIADFIRDKEPLKAVVRAGLKPVVWAARKILK